MSISLRYKQNTFELKDQESVLDCLLRNDVDIPFSCKSGACQTCLLQVTEGSIPPGAQEGLKSSYKKSNLFLSCQCVPTDHMSVGFPSDELVSIKATIIEKRSLNHNVFLLRVRPESKFECFPGQYLTLINPENVARSYSIANQPDIQGYIDLHIRMIPNGQMSNWVASESCTSSIVTIRGPAGNCFYVKEDGQDYPLVLACTGTGLAPIIGIILEALKYEHRGPISLFHGALKSEDLYFQETLNELSQRHTNFDYIPCVLNEDDNQISRSGNIEDIVMNDLKTNLKETKLYLCGAPDFVSSLKKKAFLSGIASSNIFSDSFLPTKKNKKT